MGLDTRRPPLPAPTESMDETSGPDTEVGTTLTTRTDKTSYSIPEDGSPITISTQKINAGRERGLGNHSRQKSQTSLLIEYFEASKSGDKSRNRPSVRVKVTPSNTKKSRTGSDAIQITGIGSDRKPSYTRRISLGNKNYESRRGPIEPTEPTELSHSSSSNVSGYPPVEIEVINNNNDSEISYGKSSRGLLYAPVDSNISSMPPDSMLEGSGFNESELSHSRDNDDESTIRDTDFLAAPLKSRSRSASRERLTQKVMEKLNAGSKPRRVSRGSHEYTNEEYELDSPSRDRRRRTRKGLYPDDGHISGAESSMVSSNKSYRSNESKASRITNNPRLLEMVESTIKRVIMPEINALKEDQRLQKTDRNLRSFEDSKRGSSAGGESLERRVSKSSSSPNFASKPKVVLNRDGDDPGVVLSRGDSERIKARKSTREDYSEHRPSSRRSSGKHSRRTSYDDDDSVQRKLERHETRDALAGAIAGGALTAAALRNHDSQGDMHERQQEEMHERRKKRSKSRGSRSRSASLAEAADGAYAHKDVVPPMPLASRINDSEVTRESILSQETDRANSRGPGDNRTPIRESAHATIRDGASPASAKTPTRSTAAQAFENKYLQQRGSTESPLSSNENTRTKSRTAAIAKSMEDRHMDADGYGSPVSLRKLASPAQSVSSLKKNFEDDPLVPQGLRPRSAASRSSAARLYNQQISQSSLRSHDTSPTAKLGASRQTSRDVSGDEFITPMEHSRADIEGEDVLTPGVETADEWFERQHEVNDRYRDSMGESNRDSYQTNPYPQDERRFTTYTEDSLDRRVPDDADEYMDDNAVHSAAVKQGINHQFINLPVDVESAVASLMEPSTVSSNKISSTDSPAKAHASYSDRMAEHLRAGGKDEPAIYEGSTLSQTIPSQDRWAALRGQAREMSNSAERVDQLRSPTQSPAKDARDSIDERPQMGASGLPLVDDPMPEIGHYDSQSDLTTNPSIIQGPLGGDPTGKDAWPDTPDPDHDGRLKESSSEAQLGAGIVAAGAALAGAGVSLAGARQSGKDAAPQRYTPDLGRNRMLPTDRDATPTGSPAPFRDEGYDTDAQARPRENFNSNARHMYGKEDLDDYEDAMNAHGDDPFQTTSDSRHFSANSHGTGSPLYDSSTGTGMDRIQSKDIVALMDHLTVRDAQRNARDTEILVTLVRSAAEMRQSFDEMKKFIVEQDKLIMRNSDRNAEQTVQRVLNGPRPQPMSSPRTPRQRPEDDVQAKRKGVLRRALKGLTGGKSANDLAKIEDMLMQILDNVEDLKHNGVARPTDESYTSDSLDSYEKLRAAPDAGYEPEGLAGTGSTPTQSGQFSNPPASKQQFHSGYDGRRGSSTRVSTVLEDDEDELEPHEAHVLGHQFENNERMLTPTQELHRHRGMTSSATPPQQGATLTTPDKHRKSKSIGSSFFGIPKVSRWSKTTASSAPDVGALDSPNPAASQKRNSKLSSEASRSGSALDRYDDDQYELQEDDRLRSTQSLAKEQARGLSNPELRNMRSQASRLTRTPSPLIPSEASSNLRDDHDRQGDHYPEDDDVSFDDPKYQAHRNSLLLEHPQPRQGPTGRHQNTLESQAHAFDDTTGTNSDLSQRTVSDFDPAVWGSSGTAGLARHKLANMEPISPVSMNSPNYNKAGNKDDGPLVPQNKAAAPSKQYYEPEPEPEQDWEPQYSNSGFSRGGYYSSPYGSGHLLEPIEEVRYSLETDRSSHREQSFSPEPQVASAKAVDMRTQSAHKIGGPRPMGARSPATGSQQARLVEASGTVRRKPVPRSEAGSEDSLESETF